MKINFISNPDSIDQKLKPLDVSSSTTIFNYSLDSFIWVGGKVASVCPQLSIICIYFITNQPRGKLMARKHVFFHHIHIEKLTVNNYKRKKMWWGYLRKPQGWEVPSEMCWGCQDSIKTLYWNLLKLKLI